MNKNYRISTHTEILTIVSQFIHTFTYWACAWHDLICCKNTNVDTRVTCTFCHLVEEYLIVLPVTIGHWQRWIEDGLVVVISRPALVKNHCTERMTTSPFSKFRTKSESKNKVTRNKTYLHVPSWADIALSKIPPKVTKSKGDTIAPPHPPPPAAYRPNKAYRCNETMLGGRKRVSRGSWKTTMAVKLDIKCTRFW